MLDKLSYTQYGAVVIISAFIESIIFNTVPYFVVFTFIYLISRALFKSPIHAVGLDICYALTMIFYTLMFVTVRLCNMILPVEITFCIVTFLVLITTFATSTLPNRLEKMGKLFYGYKLKGEPSKYQKLFDYLKYRGLTDEYLEAKKLLKENVTPQEYIIYKRIFEDKDTWNKVEEELDLNRVEISKAINKCYFYIIGRLGI